MNFRLFTLFFFALLLTQCTDPATSDVPTNDDRDVCECGELLYFEQESVSKLPNSETPYTGKCLVHFETGELKSEAFYVNGVMDGLRQEFYLDGKLKSEMEFKKNKQHGITKHFDKEGKVTFAGRYENGTFKEKLN